MGTLHSPPDDVPEPTRRVGMLLLNAGPAPRAGNSDLYVRIADRIAERGVHSFRFDMPGLGDSTGTPFATIGSYWSEAQRGRNTDAIIALVLELRNRYSLDQMLLGGLCAGAICAILAADVIHDVILGLVLLEPNFQKSPDPALTDPDKSTRASEARKLRGKLGRLRNLNEVLYLLTGHRLVARFCSPLQPMIERALIRRIARQLPPDANASAVTSWGRSLEREVPSLIVLASGLSADRYLRRITYTLPQVAPGLSKQVCIEQTNHIFTEGDAPGLVANAVVNWIEERFPDACKCHFRAN